MFHAHTFVTLGLALALSLIHIWAALLRPYKIVPRAYWLSFADGVSISWVILQLLPESGQVFAHLPESAKPSFARLKEFPYFPLLVSLVIFYGLEKLIELPHAAHEQDDAGLAPLRAWIYIAAYALYKILMGYLFAQITELAVVLVYAAALAMHFFVVDFHLVEIHRRVFARIGRWLLSAAFLLGWGTGVAMVISPFILALLMSFVAGAAVMLVLQEEFSEIHKSSFAAFLSGVCLYSGLAFLVRVV
jgi:zinc transporter ZupT